MKRFSYTFLTFLFAVGMVSLQAQDITQPVTGTSNFTVTQGTTVNYYDDGGPGCDDDGNSPGEYSSNANSAAVICPDVAGSVITIEFLEVDVETRGTPACWDFLTVLNGDDPASSTQLFTGCGEEGFASCPGFPGDGSDGGAVEGGPNDIDGSNAPTPVNNIFTSTDASGCLTVTFTSDASVQQGGWVAEVSASAVSMPTCSDGIQNGDETGVDCGGTSCPPCMTMPTCSDGIQNGDETGVDCGGSVCMPCGSTGGGGSGCVEPTATATVIDYCSAGRWYVAISLTDLGSATTVSITNDGGAAPLQNILALRTYFVGPFTGTSSVTITIADTDDPSCSTDITVSSGCSSALGGPGTTTPAASSFERFEIFPNPTTGEVNVNVAPFIGQRANIQLYNSMGQLVTQRQYNELQNNIERFDLSDQQNGMYLIRLIVDGQEMHTERIMLGGSR